MKKYKIVIVWWTSPFWQLWKRYFEEKWQEVIITSRSSKIKPLDAIKLWDIIIISVSIRHTVQVIKDLVPYIGENKLLMDFTWIKKEASEELSKYTNWEVVATHPMFGPWIKTLENQNIAYDRIKAWEKWDFVYNLWKNDKANLLELKSDKHDELVALVQSSVHFMNLLMWHILAKRWIHPRELLKIWTPNSRMQLFILSRFLNQEASLYTDMQVLNSTYRNEIIPEIKEFVESMSSTIINEDSAKFEQEFNNLKQFIWQDFLDLALQISSKFDEESKKYL